MRAVGPASAGRCGGADSRGRELCQPAGVEFLFEAIRRSISASQADTPGGRLLEVKGFSRGRNVRHVALDTSGAPNRPPSPDRRTRRRARLLPVPHRGARADHAARRLVAALCLYSHAVDTGRAGRHYDQSRATVTRRSLTTRPWREHMTRPRPALVVLIAPLVAAVASTTPAAQGHRSREARRCRANHAW
jgi:hypothetical protein